MIQNKDIDKRIIDVIIIGMGAAGLFAMANLPSNISVLGIEKNNIAGKKLRITGGGRCNITQLGNVKHLLNSYTHPSFVRPIINAYNNKKLMQYFESGGLQLDKEGTKVFPKSRKADEVANFLLSKIADKGHLINYGEEVIDIQHINTRNFLDDNKQYKCGEGKSSIESSTNCELIVKTNKSTYRCRKIIIATGGASFSYTGSDGKLISKLFDTVSFSTGLAPIYVNKHCFNKLQGVSANVSIKYNKQIFNGGLLFAGKYITGPVVLDLSNWVDVGSEFSVDFLPELSTDKLRQMIREFIQITPKKLVRNIIAQDICKCRMEDGYNIYQNQRDNDGKGIDKNKLDIDKNRIIGLPESIIKFIFNELNLEHCIGAELKKKDLTTIIRMFKEYKFTVREKFPLDKGMVTKGGIKVEDIDNKTMSLTYDSRVYVIGEAIELVGNSGGYNLQFAFSSAMRAINNIESLQKM